METEARAGPLAGPDYGSARPRWGLSSGWWVVIGCSLSMMVGGGLTFWAQGIYVRPLEEEFGWSRSQVSAAASIMFLVGGLIGPLVGLVVDRWGARPPVLFGAVFLGITYALLSQISTLWQLYALYAVMAFARSWVNYIPFFWLVTRWFPDRMGAPIGVMGVGFSSAGVIFVPFVTWMVVSFGWRWSFALSGLMIVVTTVPIALLLLKEPPKAAPRAQSAIPRPAPTITAGQAIRTRRFWLLASAMSLFFMGLTSFMFHAIPFYLSRGFTEGEAAGWAGAAAALSTVIRLGLGYAVDRIPNLKAFAVVEALSPAVALGILTVSTEPVAMVFFLLFWSFGTAGGPILESVLVTRSFGAASFGAILGAVGVVETVGNIIGPWLAGAIFDATGGYTAAFLLYIVGFGAAALCFALGDYRQREA
jgi:predicted MFS family arabinose efflux permease